MKDLRQRLIHFRFENLHIDNATNLLFDKFHSIKEPHHEIHKENLHKRRPGGKLGTL